MLLGELRSGVRGVAVGEDDGHERGEDDEEQNHGEKGVAK